MHYKKMFDDKEHMFAYDLDGRDFTLQIERVTAGELEGEKGRKSKKPIISFVGAKKKLAINKTNGKTIASLYGSDTDAWAGKWITIYPTTTNFGGETVECIRVRNERPQGKTAGKGRSGSNGPQRQAAAPPPDLTQQIGAEMDRLQQPDTDLSDEDKRAIEMAESEESNS